METLLSLRPTQATDQSTDEPSKCYATEEDFLVNANGYCSYGTDFDVESQESYDSASMSSDIAGQHEPSSTLRSMCNAEGGFSIFPFYLTVIVMLIQLANLPPPKIWRHECKLVVTIIILEIMSSVFLTILAHSKNGPSQRRHPRMIVQMYWAPFYISLGVSVLLSLAWMEIGAQA